MKTHSQTDPPTLDPAPTTATRRPIWIAVTVAVAALSVWAGVETAFGVRAGTARAEQWAAASEAALRRVPLLTDAEAALLRRSLNARHVRYAERFGIASLDSLGADATGLVRVDTLVAVRVLDGTHSDPLLTPGGARTLRLVAEEFRAETVQAGVPPVRPVATSLLRSAASQAALRAVNANAAAGRSSHEFGTTFDLSYRRFEPVRPVVRIEPGEAQGFRSDQLVVPASVPRPFRPLVAWRMAGRAARDADRLVTDYPSRYAALLGRALIRLEDSYQLIALRESRQPVYHVTYSRLVSEFTCGTPPFDE